MTALEGVVLGLFGLIVGAFVSYQIEKWQKRRHERLVNDTQNEKRTAVI